MSMATAKQPYLVVVHSVDWAFPKNGDLNTKKPKWGTFCGGLNRETRMWALWQLAQGLSKMSMDMVRPIVSFFPGYFVCETSVLPTVKGEGCVSFHGMASLPGIEPGSSRQ